ncbi:glycosyltransferase [Enterococcus sp. AZ007]|uniref:glycosyltransferase n=1 Tax=Enterococcus sp. AZ007 TaxID=2774839 RepID=UPI003F247EF1
MRNSEDVVNRKISVYTRDKESASSSYYRIIQYFDQMSKEPYFKIDFRPFVPMFLTKLIYNHPNNYFVRILYHLSVLFFSTFQFTKDIFRKPDVVVILRSITPKTFTINSFLYERMLKNAGKVIWDFDDDIFCSNEITKDEKNLLCKYSTDIVVTHSYLASLLPQDFMGKIHLLPTTDQVYTTLKDRIERKESYESVFFITWVGSSASVQYIDLFIKEIEHAARELFRGFNKKIIFEVVSNKPYSYKNKFEEFQVINSVWTREKAIESMQKAHLGIMPLSNNRFERGKGSFKLIQYMANSLPVIGSNVGYNKEVVKSDFGYLLNENEIEPQLSHIIMELATDKNSWLTMSELSYKEWKKNYDFEMNLEKWKELLNLNKWGYGNENS